MPSCEIEGHVFGSRGICVMCKTPKEQRYDCNGQPFYPSEEQRPSKDQLRLWRQRVETYGGMQLTKPESLALFDEIERLQGREREAFRLANAATYLVAPTYSLHAELKAFMDGQVGKPDDSTPEPAAEDREENERLRLALRRIRGHVEMPATDQQRAIYNLAEAALLPILADGAAQPPRDGQ